MTPKDQSNKLMLIDTSAYIKTTGLCQGRTTRLIAHYINFANSYVGGDLDFNICKRTHIYAFKGLLHSQY